MSGKNDGMILSQVGSSEEEQEILEGWVNEMYERNNGEVSKNKLRKHLRNSPELTMFLLGHNQPGAELR